MSATEHNQAAERIAAEMVALGAEPRAALVAAGSMLTFPTDADFGLGALEDGATRSKARTAIRLYRAAQAKVAA